jgi:hypothetical protein
MREQILKLINENAKTYVRTIKKDPKLLEWIKQNTLVTDESLPAQIYSAIYQQTNKCPNGKIRKFGRISTGFTGCGPASSCPCTSQRISARVALTKSKYSADRRMEINTQRQKSMLMKYGVEFNSQREDIKHIWTKSKMSVKASQCLGDYSWLNEQYNVLGKSLVDIADELNIYYGTVAEYCRRHGFKIRRRSNYSLEEKRVAEYLDELGVKYELGNWSILGNKELDIYLPEHKLAIEINGLYWHSWTPNGNKPEYKQRHIDKTSAAEAEGIALLHITDFEWNHKTDIVKSIIKSKIGLNNRIFARSCEIKLVGTKEQKLFLEATHLQGYVACHAAVGLYHNNELVQLITIGKSRFSKEFDLEILRFCSMPGITVVGGLSKLLKFIKQKYGTNIVTYCDRAKSQAVGYIAAGFQLINKTGPGYFWTDGSVPISRYRCQKTKLSKWLPSFSMTLTESQNMFAAGYRRFWDCGNLVLKITE